MAASYNEFDNPTLNGWINRTMDPTYVQMQYNTAERLAAQEFNSSEAQKNRDWQEYMSGSAYQRARADLEAAGLNPYLAYSQGGAVTPSGYAASSNAAFLSGGRNTQDVLKAFMSLMANTAAGINRLSNETAIAQLRADNAFKMLNARLDYYKAMNDQRGPKYIRASNGSRIGAAYTSNRQTYDYNSMIFDLDHDEL